MSRVAKSSDDDANARGKAPFSAAIRDGTGSAVGDADGVPGWGRFQSTRFTDANGSSTTELAFASTMFVIVVEDDFATRLDKL